MDSDLNEDLTEAEAFTPDTVVLIHGLWMTPRSWEGWVSYYEAKGYKVLTPFQHIGILSLEFHVDKLSRPLL